MKSNGKRQHVREEKKTVGWAQSYHMSPLKAENFLWQGAVWGAGRWRQGKLERLEACEGFYGLFPPLKMQEAHKNVSSY